MKLVFIMENPVFVGGGEYSVFKYAEHLARLGNEVIVFAASKNDYMKDPGMPGKLRIHSRGKIKRYFKGFGLLDRIYASLYTTIVVRSFLKKNSDVDFIIGYLRDTAIKAVELGQEFGIKTANFAFESPPWMEKDLGERWRKEYQGRFRKSWEKTREAYLKSDILIGTSLKSQVECEKWLQKKVQGFAYPAMDFRLADSVRQSKKNNQVLYLGRLNEYKNIPEIFYALKKMPRPPLLVLIGGGEDSGRIKALAKKLEVKAKFLGSVSEEVKYREIKKSSFLVFPSSHEGFGMPPMEALYCGVPCICSDKPVFKEVYGNKVEYFREHDADDFAKKMHFLLNNPAYVKRRGKERRAYVRKKFGWEKSARKIQHILSLKPEVTA